MLLEKEFDSAFAQLIEAVTQTKEISDNTDTLLEVIGKWLGTDNENNKNDSLQVEVTHLNETDKVAKQSITADMYKTPGGTLSDSILDDRTKKEIGFTAADFKAEGYTPDQLTQISGKGEDIFTLQELREVGQYSAKEVKDAFSDVGESDLKEALEKAGYDSNEINSLFNTTPTTNSNNITSVEKIIQDVRAAFKKVSLDAKSGKAGVGVPGALSAMKSIKGKTVAIQNQTGHVGANGWIYWDRKGMVRKYNPETGQVVSIPYSKKSYINEANPKVSPYVYQEFRESLHTRKVKGYKTGGLATETGPAWLHGTPSKPELVLNAQDTRNFIALKDVLSRAINAVGDTDGYGNANFEININVDHVNSDYDVDRIAERVKKDIVKSAGYRNVTSVRKFR